MSDELKNSEKKIRDEDLDLIPQYIKLSLNEDQKLNLLDQIKEIKNEITDLLSDDQSKELLGKINALIKLKILNDISPGSDEHHQKKKEKIIKLAEEINITTVENLSLFEIPSEDDQEEQALTEPKELFTKEVLSLVRKIKELDWKLKKGNLNNFEVKNVNTERNNLERKLIREGGTEALILLDPKRKINFVGVFEFIQDLLLDQHAMLKKDNPLSKEFFSKKEHLKGLNSKEYQYKDDIAFLLSDLSSGVKIIDKVIENQNDFRDRINKKEVFSSNKDTSYAQSTFDALMYFRDFRYNYHLYTEEVSLDILRKSLNHFDAAIARNALNSDYNLSIVAMYLTVLFQYLVILRNKLKFEIKEINNFDYSENISTPKKEHRELQESIQGIVTQLSHRLGDVTILLSYKKSVKNIMKKTSSSAKKDPVTLLGFLALVPHVFDKTIVRALKDIKPKKSNIELMIFDAQFDFQYRIANTVQEKNNGQSKSDKTSHSFPIYNKKTVSEKAFQALDAYALKAKKSNKIEDISYCIRQAIQIIEKCRKLSETSIFSNKEKIKETGNRIFGWIEKLRKMVKKGKKAGESAHRSLISKARSILNIWYTENDIIVQTSVKKTKK